MVVDRTRLVLACMRGVFAFPLAGKGKSMRVRFMLLAAGRAAARFDRDLTMVSCSVALSTTRGDSMSVGEPQSWPIKVIQRGAID